MNVAFHSIFAGKAVFKMPRWVGLDVHKSYLHVVELRDGGVREEYRVGIPKELSAFKQRLGSDVHLAMEASNGSFRLADELRPHVGRLVITHAKQTRGIIGHAAVTDRKAADGLARVLASGYATSVWVPGPGIRALRSLVELRLELLTIKAAATQRLRALLANELIEGPPRGELFSDRMRSFLEGAFHDDPLRLECAHSLTQLYDFLTLRKARIDEMLHDWSAKNSDALLLMTIPGVGHTLAATILAQIDDINRFDSAAKLCSYAGLVPRVYQTGKTRRTGAISKTGRRALRWAMAMAAFSGIRSKCPLREFKERLSGKRPGRVVLIACARKLLTVVWHVLKSRQPYKFADQEALARKERRPRTAQLPRPEGMAVPKRRTAGKPTQDTPPGGGDGVQKPRKRGRPAKSARASEHPKGTRPRGRPRKNEKPAAP